jgi:LysM repeat protein
MKKRTTGIVLLLLFLAAHTFAQQKEIVNTYIARYKDLAIAEMRRTGVPAAITLAQGIHESGAGNSKLVLESNNHFGIKCKSNWTGESVKHDDDAKGECFRKYPQPEDSYKDHSDFLKNGQRYASLFSLDPADYTGWANGLKKAGYATNPQYPQVLIKLIEDYNLQQYTQIAMAQPAETGTVITAVLPAGNSLPATNGPVLTGVMDASQPDVPVYPEGEFKINETKVIFAKKGTSFLAIARQYDTDLSKIFEFNDMSPADLVIKDQLVYLQRKRKTSHHAFHLVQPGESLHDIAQAEAIRTESLMELNWLKANEQPAPGEFLSLREKSATIPKLTIKENYSLIPASTKKGNQ